jgi:nucleoside-diphosphate-sugar epimerase
MKLLLTGHQGYLGAVIGPMLLDAGHDVVGLDAGWFADCWFGAQPPHIANLKRDVRDVGPEELRGFGAVVHLAALSNDPLGDLNPTLTYAINHEASVSLAIAARAAGVERFVFSSSCSLYGAAVPGELLTEQADFNPVTPYGESKLLVERDVRDLANDDFSPVYLRNATAYGHSRLLRGDLMVNNLVAYAVTTGEVRIKSDGTPWRPLVHVEDIGLAVLAALEAPRESIHDEAFNIGRTQENYQVRDVAAMVAGAVSGAQVEYASDASPDVRNYQVSFAKAERSLPGFEPSWTVAAGIDQLVRAYHDHALSLEDFLGPRYQRIATVREHLAAGRLDSELRWQGPRSPAG